METKDNFYFFKGTKEEDLYSYNVSFQGKSLSLIHLDRYYMQQIENLHNGELGYEIEVLPSIYYRKRKSGLLKSPFRQKFKITIEVRNIRDYFKIAKVDYSKIVQNELGSEVIHYKKTKYIKENLYIDPQKLPYPYSLGGGQSTCDIWRIFTTLQILDRGDELYSLLDNKRMFEVSSCNNRLLEVCINSKHCGKIIKKMKEGKYEAKFEVDNSYYDDDITVELEDGTYYLNEGKHRVCMAKRFNIELIPAQVTTIIRDNSVKPKGLNNVKSSYLKPVNCVNILTDCYEKYKRLGLSKEKVRELNETVSDRDLVNFIETTVGKTLTEIEREIIN